MSLRLAMLLVMTGAVGSTGFVGASPAQELQWRDLDEISDLAKSQPRPVLWFRVLGDMKGYL